MVSQRLIVFLALLVTVNAGLLPLPPILSPILPGGDGGCNVEENTIVDLRIVQFIPTLLTKVLVGGLFSPGSVLITIQNSLNLAFPDSVFTVLLFEDVSVIRSKALESEQSITITIPLISVGIWISVTDRDIVFPVVPIAPPSIKVPPPCDCEPFKSIQVGSFFTPINVKVVGAIIEESYTLFAGSYRSISIHIKEQLSIKLGGSWNVIIGQKAPSSSCWQQKEIYGQFQWSLDIITCYR